MTRLTICQCWRKPGIADPDSDGAGTPDNPWTMTYCDAHGFAALAGVIDETNQQGGSVAFKRVRGAGETVGVEMLVVVPADTHAVIFYTPISESSVRTLEARAVRGAGTAAVV